MRGFEDFVAKISGQQRAQPLAAMAVASQTITGRMILTIANHRPSATRKRDRASAE
jgi:hypothetical protein